MFLPRASAGLSTVTWTMPPDDWVILSPTTRVIALLKLDPNRDGLNGVIHYPGTTPHGGSAP